MSNQQDRSQGTSEVSAKEVLNTHGSGEPSADNVEVSAYEGSDYDEAISNTNPEADQEDHSQKGTSEIFAK